MPIDAAPTRSPSRRTLLRTALAGVAGAVAATLGRPSVVRAGVDGDVVLGATNVETDTTSIQNNTTTDSALELFGIGSGLTASGLAGSAILAFSSQSNGLTAQTDTGIGVHGQSQTIGISGQASNADGVGVLGFAIGNGIGVAGVSADGGPLEGTLATKVGVYGRSSEDTASVGVRGETTAGTGMHAIATSGTGAVGSSGSGVGVVGASFEGADLGWPSPITPSTGVYGVSVDGTGVYGASDTGAGVYGANHGVGVAALVGQGNDGTAVHGHAGAYPLPAAPSLTGVYGTAYGGGTGIAGFSGPDDATPPVPPANTGVHGYAGPGVSSRGVVGESPAGQGVRGVSTTGIGMRGYSESGVAGSFETASGMALVTKGRVRFQNIAGKASLAPGGSSVTVTPGVDLTSGSAILATLNGDPGVATAVQRVTIDTAANTFTVHLTASPLATVRIAWFVLDQ